MGEREYLSLPVPVEFLPQMTAYLADLERGIRVEGDEPAAPSARAAAVPDPETGSNGTVRRKAGIVWSADQWASVHDKENVSSGRVLRFVNQLPVGEANAAPLGKLAAQAAMSGSELRAALSWLTRHVRRTPGVYPTDSWPFGWKVGQKVDPQNPFEFHYWISPEQRATVAGSLPRWLEQEA